MGKVHPMLLKTLMAAAVIAFAIPAHAEVNSQDIVECRGVLTKQKEYIDFPKRVQYFYVIKKGDNFCDHIRIPKELLKYTYCKIGKACAIEGLIATGKVQEWTWLQPDPRDAADHTECHYEGSAEDNPACR